MNDITNNKGPNYFQKMKGKTVRAELPKVAPDQVVWSFIGGFVALFVVAYLAQEANLFSLFAPFGASAVLLFGAPVAPFSQPRNLMVGHIVSAAIGVLMFNILGNTYYSVALGVGLAIGVMVAIKSVHPPAGATALIGVTASGGNFMWVLSPVALGALILLIVALIVNNLDKKRIYPQYWF